ncbi:MAG TPA: AmmeMemoRadiSam system protein B [Burkholderiaceae bacterium]|jgi:hypothetical protein|nr:AmmeMemoRadiSam system protein B [Burkholderiaceae bacterium]
MPTVRRAVVDGLLYPAAPELLRARIAECLAGAAAVAAHCPKVIVVPHAGYDYCGAVAACAYALLAPPCAGAIHRVVLLGPVHRMALELIAASTAQAFETPLGRVPIDIDALAALADLPQVMRNDRTHEREHSLEVQLPFLQALLGAFTLVPLIVGDVAAEAMAQVLERLWGGDETLLVISSDLSHYLPYEQAQALDQATAQRILHLDASLTRNEACGAAAINGALLAARRHGLAPHLLDLRNSGDTAGERDRVVGYAALAFAANDARTAPPAPTPSRPSD